MPSAFMFRIILMDVHSSEISAKYLTHAVGSVSKRRLELSFFVFTANGWKTLGCP